MILKKVETEKEIIMMSRMKAGSKAQNHHIVEMQKNGEIDYNNCFIMIEKGKVIARVMILDGEHLAFFTLANIGFDKACQFIRYVLQEGKLQRAEMHLYSDKMNHALVKQSLLATGFKIIQQKESYVIKPVRCESKLRCKNGKEINKEIFVDMIRQVYDDHKDRAILKDLEYYGLDQASHMLYEDGDSKHPEYYLAAYDDDIRVGFVFLCEVSENTAVIGYIGVLPQQRGKHYSTELLKLASSLAYQKGYQEIIADIDTENFAMRENLLRAGYQKSCDEIVFQYE